MKMDSDAIPAPEDNIKSLCRKVEDTVGVEARTPKHFEQIVVRIFDRTGTLLSATTLKRIWGYLSEPVTPRKSTLDVLAQCCGWRDYDDFVCGNKPEIESGIVGSRVLNAEKDLVKGDIVRLMWTPSRVCVIRYSGTSDWTVIRSEGTRLKPGDTFRCSTIIAGEPLYLDNLVHQGSRPGIYVCGRRHGVGFMRGDMPEDQTH